MRPKCHRKDSDDSGRITGDAYTFSEYEKMFQHAGFTRPRSLADSRGPELGRDAEEVTARAAERSDH
jgi:hypothetical protein